MTIKSDSDFQAVLDNEVRLRLAMKAARVGLWDFRPGDEQVGANDEVARLLGYDPEEFNETRAAFVSRLHPEDRERVRSLFKRYLDGQIDEYSVEFRMRMRDGHYRWFRSIGEIVERNPQAQPLRVIGVYLDIDDHVQAVSRLSDLSSSVLRVQETERAHLARELHDEWGQQLTAMKLNMHALSTAETPWAVSRRAADCITMLDEMLSRVRDKAFDLRPALLDDLGLGPALESWCAGQEQRSDICILLDGTEGLPRFSNDLETAVFRVIQEGVTNALKHASCETIEIWIAIHSGVLRVTIRDDGKGFDLLQQSADPASVCGDQGFGLRSMKERMRLIHGEISVESQAASGTTVMLRVPLES